MKFRFCKYQGAGNDFVIIDNREPQFRLSTQQIAFLCDRRFGIGGDGLMLLENAANFDFRMVYFNADGRESTMCGNGGRCIASFAFRNKIASENQSFVAIDGPHLAKILEQGNVSLQMQDVEHIEYEENATILNTGSPHYVVKENEVELLNVAQLGREIRNQDRFQPNGINVNFYSTNDSFLNVRTYERGVEDETLACGTGVTAVAIASTKGQIGHFDLAVKAMGGNLSVRFDKINEQEVRNIWLTGPATFVFEAEIELKIE